MRRRGSQPIMKKREGREDSRNANKDEKGRYQKCLRMRREDGMKCL